MTVLAANTTEGLIVQAMTAKAAVVSALENTLATPDAGHRIVVKFIMAQNESENLTKIEFKDGDTTRFQVLAVGQGDGLALPFANGFEWRLAVNSPLVLALSDTNNTGYSVFYWSEPA